MFICEQCLSQSYENTSSGFMSFGTCEICKQSKPCNDIPSKHLIVRRAKPEKVYRPLWVEKEFLKVLGYDLIKDEDGYMKYQSDGKTAKCDSYGLLPKGKRLIYLNLTYNPDKKEVFMGIEEDGGTRNVFNGVVKTLEDIELILNRVR